MVPSAAEQSLDRVFALVDEMSLCIQRANHLSTIIEKELRLLTNELEDNKYAAH